PAQEASPAPRSRALFADAGDRCEQPQLAVRVDGTLAAVFVAGGTSVRVALRAPGADWQPSRAVAAVANLAVGMHRGPRIAWARNAAGNAAGNAASEPNSDALLVACIESHWDSATRTAQGSGDLTVRRSTDGGASWSPPCVVNGEA